MVCGVSRELCVLNLRRGQPFETYAQDIQDKNAEEVEKYYKVFEERWKTLSGKFLYSHFLPMY
jgi:hypothetical protein